jgi:hypothetical protein
MRHEPVHTGTETVSDPNNGQRDSVTVDQAVVFLGQIAARLPMIDVACNHCDRRRVFFCIGDASTAHQCSAPSTKFSGAPQRTTCGPPPSGLVTSAFSR